MTSSEMLASRKRTRSDGGAIQGSDPVPSRKKSRSAARAKTGDNASSVTAAVVATGHAQTPSGKQRSEPRCDMPPKRNPPSPCASITTCCGRCGSPTRASSRKAETGFRKRSCAVYKLKRDDDAKIKSLRSSDGPVRAGTLALAATALSERSAARSVLSPRPLPARPAACVRRRDKSGSARR